ncbi:MAG: hypothetical protein EPN23_05835 [Verrucomicrobia bacterium]|nr:MAG: hypothetical protein EPN23_05835 [Verrucomicrobiota bacterium]
MKKLALFAVVMGLATSSQAVKLQEGTQALDLSGNWDFQRASEQLRVGYGYFIMDYFEVGGLLEYAHNENMTAFGFGPKAEYNFELDIPVVVPFVGASAQFKHGKVSTTQMVTIAGTGAAGNPASTEQVVADEETKNALTANVYGGAKFFITDAFAVSAALVVEAATTDIFVKKDGDTSKTDARVELGLRYYF